MASKALHDLEPNGLSFWAEANQEIMEIAWKAIPVRIHAQAIW